MHSFVRQLSIHEVRDINQIFASVDTDGSGFIDRDELKILVGNSDFKIEDDELTRILNELDSD